ncbi:hypothetical protein QUF81_00175 [Peribacillus simplex]|uniref:hypothetical protein n=1 Tax=Peribacillus simplex TaxID=1478 RepID=UPI0025A23C50|nr:hypothetical protein [Peribacillus simplex]MDM5291718.1 hypothetical protein [Peribacillus simplex]
MSIDDILKDGFHLRGLERNITDYSFISLKTALNSYFSTYKRSNLFFARVLTEEENKGEKNHGYENDYYYITQYIEAYTETILHFQHFIELVCKEILRKENELLVLNIDHKHELFYRLLNKEVVEPSEFEGLRTKEFSATYQRLCALIDNNKLDSRYNFLSNKKNKKVLEALNDLRNRIWHRGTFVMRYKSLDKFIGGYILPIINEIVSLPEFNEMSYLWKYKSVQSGIDPIKELLSELAKEKFDLGKVAFLKEIGRAAYSNPLNYKMKFFNTQIIESVTRTAEREVESFQTPLYDCPVCGIESLVTYEESDGEMEQDGSFSSYWTFSYAVKCHCCSFYISRELKNPNKYGFNLPDYWYGIEH